MKKVKLKTLIVLVVPMMDQNIPNCQMKVQLVLDKEKTLFNLKDSIATIFMIVKIRETMLNS